MKLLEYIRSYLLACMGGGGKKILFPARLDKYTSLEKPNYVGRHYVLIGAKVGRYTYFGNNCEFYYSQIGRFCSIANDVKLIRGQHPTSTHVFYITFILSIYDMLWKGGCFKYYF